MKKYSKFLMSVFNAGRGRGVGCLMAATVGGAIMLLPGSVQAGLITDTKGWVTGLSDYDAQNASSFSTNSAKVVSSLWKANADLGVAAGAFPVAGQKYLLTQKRLRTPTSAKQSLVFAGDALAIDGGELSLLLAGSVGAVSFDNLQLCSGQIDTWSASHPTIAGGTVTVYSPENKPFVIQSRGNSVSSTDPEIGLVEITAKLKSDATYAGTGVPKLRFQYYSGVSSYKAPCTIRLSGDCSEYTGKLDVYSDVVFSVGNATETNFPAALILSSGAVIEPIPGTLTRFASATLPSDNDVELRYVFEDGKDFGSLAFTALTTGESGKVPVTVSGFVPLSTTPTNRVLLEASANLESLLEIDASTLTNELGLTAGVLTHEWEGGRYRLTLSTGYVWLTTSDGVVTYQESDERLTVLALTNAASWTPQILPQSGYEYYVPKNMRLRTRQTIADPEKRNFPGNTLTVAGTFAYEMSNDATFDVGDLRFVGQSPTFFTQLSGSWTLTGRVHLATEADYPCLLENYGARDNKIIHTYAVQLTGSSDLTLYGHSGSGQSAGRAHFTGDNSAWTGGLYVTMQNTTGSKGQYIFPQMASGYCTELRFDEEKNLGGALASFRYDALKIDQMAVLYPTRSVTLAADSNRGILIGSGSNPTNRIARFRVDKNLVMTVQTPITYKGILIKENPGTLVLGGRALFTDGKEATAPTAGNNALVVTGGCLKVVSSTALDGVAVTFSPGTKLLLSGKDDEDNKAVGLYDVKINNPLDLSPVGGVLDVAFDATTCGSRREATYGICTVNAEAAKGLSPASFRVASPSWQGYHMSVVATTNDLGYVTYAVQSRPQGLALMFR